MKSVFCLVPLIIPKANLKALPIIAAAAHKKSTGFIKTKNVL